jgi:hypothetical protein
MISHRTKQIVGETTSLLNTNYSISHHQNNRMETTKITNSTNGVGSSHEDSNEDCNEGDRYQSSAVNHRGIGMDQMPLLDDELPSGVQLRRESFIQEFISSNGPPQIVILIILLALGFGSVIGVVRTNEENRVYPIGYFLSYS